MDGRTERGTRLPQRHLCGVLGATDGEVARQRLVGSCPSGRPGPRSSASTASAFEARLPWSLEYRLRRADGAYRWMLASGVPKYGPDGSFTGYVGCDIDITERRNAEDQIRESQAALEASHREIQQLAGRLIEAQDAERARIARDLHDDVSQQLAGLSIALSGLKRRMDELNVSDELQDGSAGASRAHHCTRAERPSPLPRPASDRAATCRAGGRTDFLLSPKSSDRTARYRSAAQRGTSGPSPPEVALCLYRIAQEGLRNVVAHAGASRADVRLLRSGDEVELTVTDNGSGFDVTSSLERGKGLGLVSIAERVRFAQRHRRHHGGIEEGNLRARPDPGEGAC